MNNILLQRLCALTLLAQVAMCLPAFSVPVIEEEALTGSLRAGDPIEMRYTVRWSGEPDAYIIEPPVADAVEGWDNVHVASAVARRSGDTNETTFVVSLLSNEPGSREIPGMTFSYYAPVGEGEDLLKEILFSEGTSVEVVPPTDTRLIILVSVAVVLSLLAGFAVLRSRRTSGRATVSGPRDDSFAGTLHAARAHRLDGDYYSFYQELIRAAGKLPHGSEVKALRQRLNGQARAVGYQAQIPTPDELDGDLRELERLHASIEYQE